MKQQMCHNFLVTRHLRRHLQIEGFSVNASKNTRSKN
jgi:hypothetical protein